jgi:transketolase
MRDAFVDCLTVAAETEPRIFLITGDLGFGVLTRFQERFPRQFLNVGVAEQNMTGIATGMALEGRIVYTYSIGNFPTLRCLEQIRNDASYHEANVKVVAIGGGFSYGALGMSHHAMEDIAILRSIPGITVVVPGDDWEASQATIAISRTPGTCYLRLDKSSAGNTASCGELFQLGVARVIAEGNDITLVVAGGILSLALEAAEALAKRGLFARVLSMHTIKPLDGEAIRRACVQTGGIVTIEEHNAEGGLGGAVSEWCMDQSVFPRSFARVAMRAGFSTIVGSQVYLRDYYGLGLDGILSACESVLAAGLPSTQTSIYK